MRPVVKRSGVVTAAFVVHMAVMFVMTVLWNYDQGSSLSESLTYFKAVGHGWVVIFLPAFLMGLAVYEGLSVSGGDRIHE